MSNLAVKINEVSDAVERLEVPAIDARVGVPNVDAQNDANTTAPVRSSLSMRSRLRAPAPVDQGFRPFRVF